MRTPRSHDAYAPQQGVSLLPDGRVLLELKREWNDGTSHLVFEPLDLLARLVQPEPRSRPASYSQEPEATDAK